MAAPGVVVTTATRSGPTGVVRAPSGQYFAIGITERGPVDVPAKINSMADYRRVFGDRVSYGTLYDDLAAFFECGGAQAHVLRVVGEAATLGTLTVADTLGAPTLRFDASSPGAWSTRVTVEIVAGTNANTRRIVIRLDGKIMQFYDNLTSISDIVQRFATSSYVKVTDLGSPSAEAAALPATGPAEALSAGGDDRVTVNAARLTTQLALMKVGYGDGAVAAPGYGQSMHAALIEHARTHRRIAILGMSRGTTRDELITTASNLSTVAGAEYAGLFAGWLQISDGVGGVRTISPEGYVAASRARAHDEKGPWLPAAGESSLSPYILGVDQEFSQDDAELMEASRVNPIRIVSNRIRLYGWRSLSANDADFGYLTVGDSLNRITTEAERRLEPFVFRTIDGRGQLLSQMQGVLIGVLEPIRAAGGLYEKVDLATKDVLDPGYAVDVSPSSNPDLSLAQNQINATIAARLAPNAAMINLTIVKVGLTAAV